MTRVPSPSPTVDPQHPWKLHPARIAAVQQECPGVATYELQFEDPETRAKYCFLPGQFNMLYLPGFGESAISISSDAAHPEKLLHTIRVVGNVTKAISRLRVGEPLLLRGPFGSAWPLASLVGQDIILACGGVGLAPLRSVVLHVLQHREQFGRVWLLYGARSPRDLLYVDELETWKAAGIDVEVTVDLGDETWEGHIGVVPQLFAHLRLEATRTQVLTCGPEIMMRFVIFECLARNIPASQIYLSMERSMNCALGHCGHCQLGPAFICKDGPVFSYDQMERYFHVEQF